MRTVLLGSGFSASFGLPTLLGLFDELMDQEGRAGDDDISNLHKAVPWFYPDFKLFKSPYEYPPFEQFLSLVDAARGLPSFEPGYWEPIWKSALRLLTDYLKAKITEAQDDPLLVSFADRLRPGDVVVTFNWDGLVERALHKRGIPFDLRSRSAHSVSVFKLHGSINWVRVPEPWTHAVPTSVVLIGEGVYRTVDYSTYDVWDALDSPPLIVPPTAMKNPLADPFLNPLWRAASDAIREAEELVVVGYSMPDDDLQARALLCTAFRARSRPYKLVDPRIEVSEKYKRWIAVPHCFHHRRFDADLLDEVLPAYP